VLGSVARQGFALLDQELEEGLRSIAVPIHDRDGAVVAAMNISASARRSTPSAIRSDLPPPLQAAAREIELDLRRAGRACAPAGPSAQGPSRGSPERAGDEEDGVLPRCRTA
jgi:IclR family pca regulon transcriptional regulator